MKEQKLRRLSYWGQFIGGVFAAPIVIAAGITIWEQLSNQSAQLKSQQAQLDQIKESQRIAANADLAAWCFELDKALIQYPEARKYLEDKVPISPSDPNYQRVVGIAEMFMDVIDSMLEAGYVPNKGWEQWMDDMFANSPILRKHLRDRMGWYAQAYPRFQKWEEKQKKETGKVPD